MIVMSLNESGLLSKLHVLAATLVHFHRFICTTIMRVGMTQISVAVAMHRTNNFGVTLARLVNDCTGGEHLAAISSVFRHICARYWNYRKRHSLTRTLRRDCFYEKFAEVFLARRHGRAAGFARCNGAEPCAV